MEEPKQFVDKSEFEDLQDDFYEHATSVYHQLESTKKELDELRKYAEKSIRATIKALQALRDGFVDMDEKINKIEGDY
jgi:DNA polymerase III delta prime subunit